MGIENPVHLIFIAAVALIVLGPRRLPDLAKALGNGLREFRTALSEGAEGGHEQDHAYTPPAPAATQAAPPPAEPAVQPAVASPAPPAAAPPAAFSGPEIGPPAVSGAATPPPAPAGEQPPG